MAERGGALGDVASPVVAAAFVFFNPQTVAEMWDRSAKVMDRPSAVRAFAGCAASWAEEHLEGALDYARFAELAGTVVRGASPAGLELFAAWTQVDEPERPKALALHRMNVLRELRGALHGAAVIANGLDPRTCVMLKSPHMAAVFGWSEPHPDPEPCRRRWEIAEAATDRAMGQRLAVLGEDERGEFVELAVAAHRGRS